jgi:hypothetical protein
MQVIVMQQNFKRSKIANNPCLYRNYVLISSIILPPNIEESPSHRMLASIISTVQSWGLGCLTSLGNHTERFFKKEAAAWFKAIMVCPFMSAG